MATNLPSCFSIQFLEQLLKFLVNVTLLKYVKSQRSYGFLIIKEMIFGFQMLDLKDRHFSASLIILTGNKNSNKIKIAESGQLAVGIHPFDCKHTFVISGNADRIGYLYGEEGVCEKVSSRVKWAGGYY